MKKTIPETEKLYHIGLCKKQLDSAKIAILPGDPARVELLAKLLDTQSLYLSFNREYCSYLATVGKEKILVISTGMGSPSAAIAVEELAMLGIKKFIRVGTTGAIQEKINLGDLILNTGAVRLEGTSSHYVPIEYPAIADFELTQSLRQAAQKLQISIAFRHWDFFRYILGRTRKIRWLFWFCITKISRFLRRMAKIRTAQF